MNLKTGITKSPDSNTFIFSDDGPALSALKYIADRKRLSMEETVFFLICKAFTEQLGKDLKPLRHEALDNPGPV